MKLKRKLFWYDFTDGLGYLVTGLLWFLSAILFLYILDKGVISKDAINLLIGILVLIMIYPICKRIGLFLEEKNTRQMYEIFRRVS